MIAQFVVVHVLLLYKATGLDEFLCMILRLAQSLARFFTATIISCISIFSAGLSLRGF